MKYKVGDKLLYKVINQWGEVVDMKEGVYEIHFDNGFISHYGRDYVEGSFFISRENKEKTKEEPMKKEKRGKSSKGYRFRVSSLLAIDRDRIEKESLTKENPVAILHSKGEFKVVVHDSLWMKGVWGVDEPLSKLFEKAYHAVGGDFRPMDKNALETFLVLAKMAKYAPWKNQDVREIRVDIPEL